MRKNVASQVVSAQLVSSTDGSAVTAGTTTVYVCGDGGTQASGGTATHEGQGTWSFLPSQANTNYNQVTFTFVNSSAIAAMVQLYPVAYDPTDAADLGVTALTGHTPQTGDSYAIVNNGTYGNAQLVRSTTPANTLDVSATGEAGVDWANVGGQGTSVDLSATAINLCDTVTTLTGHTAQTGDTYALANGANGFAAIVTDLDDVKGTAFVKDTHSLTDITADVTGLAGAAMRGTDSALLASSAPTNFSSMGIEADGHVHGDLKEWLGVAPLALTSQRVASLVGAMGTGVVTADAIATDAIGSAEFAASAAQKIRDEILPTQNAAFNNIQFLFVAASDHVTPVTGATGMAVTRSIDGGAFGSGTGTGPAQIGNGIYQYDASAADMNGGVITFRFTATGGTPGAPDDAFVTIVTGGGV